MKQIICCPSKAIRRECIRISKTSLNPSRRQKPKKCRPGGSQVFIRKKGPHLDTHIAVEKAHGFLTTRTLTASTLLTEHSDWPGLAQVYQYQVERKHLRTREITQQTQYGITSLAPQDASAEDLLTLRRGHWTIENKVHWIRDVVFGEDASQVRTGGSRKSWRHCATPSSLFCDSMGIQRSPKRYDFRSTT